MDVISIIDHYDQTLETENRSEVGDIISIGLKDEENNNLFAPNDWVHLTIYNENSKVWESIIIQL